MGALALTRYAVERGQPVTAVVVDVLSFTTCVSVAADRGITVHPYHWQDESAASFAAEHGAVLARPRQAGNGGRRGDVAGGVGAGITLSPKSIREAQGVDAVVLPSPNGSSISALLSEAGATVVAGSLRNGSAVGAWLAGQLADSAVVVLVPAGERWPDGSLRPAAEDLWGAGAVASALMRATTGGPASGIEPLLLSPEADLARAAYEAARERITDLLGRCSSGRELAQRGWADDVAIAGEIDASSSVPVLRGGVFEAVRPTPPDRGGQIEAGRSRG